MYRIPARRRLLTTTATTAWLLATFFAGVSALEIKHLHVPQAVQSGVKELTLDCEYTYEEADLKDLVVKWYRIVGAPGNLSTQQVYQWIVPKDPQDLGILRGKLDTKFEVTNDTYSKHRALRILKPTTSLSGEYRCHVSSDANDAILSQHMIVYSPPNDIWINASHPNGLTVNVTCGAQGGYPEPIMELGITKGSKKTRNIVRDAVQRIVPNGDFFDVIVYKEFDIRALNSETVFDCVVSVPKTTYSIQDSLTYHVKEYVGGSDENDLDPSTGQHAESESSNRRLNRNHDSPRSVPTIANTATTLMKAWSISGLFPTISSLIYLRRFVV